MKKQRGFASQDWFSMIWCAIVFAAIGGWIANLVKLIGTDMAHTTGMVIARGVGIVIVPLGAILGFL